MRTLIVLIPARREGSETATKSGDNTRATTDNQHFTCRSQSPAPDSSAARPQYTAKTNSQAAGPPPAAQPPTPKSNTKTTAQPRPAAQRSICKPYPHSPPPKTNPQTTAQPRPTSPCLFANPPPTSALRAAHLANPSPAAPRIFAHPGGASAAFDTAWYTFSHGSRDQGSVCRANANRRTQLCRCFRRYRRHPRSHGDQGRY